MKTIAVASGKGGVGKSTVTTQLASVLANNGYKVGIIDADIYGPCQYGLLSAEETEVYTNEQQQIIPGYSAKHKLHYISVNNFVPNSEDTPMLWRAPIATKLIREFLQQVAWPQLDFLFVDLPPGTGDIQITIAQLAKLDGAIIVTTPQKVAYGIAAKAIQMFNKVNVPILGIVENMSSYVCSNCNHENKIFNHDVDNGGKILAEKYQSKLLGAIPLEQNLVTLSDSGQSIIDLPADNLAKKAYLKITEQLLLKLAIQAHETDHLFGYKLLNNSLLEIKDQVSTKQLSAYDLRVSCACALCKDEVTGQQLLNKNMVSKNITITNVHEVGNYGLRFTFSDGHGTGIYNFSKMFSAEYC